MGLVADGDRLETVELDVIDGYEFVVTMLGEVGNLFVDVGEGGHVRVCVHGLTPFCESVGEEF